MAQAFQTNNPNDATKTRTRKGFTGHEMVDGAGIVHMQGRIYDPRLGRFLQADPVIQDPGRDLPVPMWVVYVTSVAQTGVLLALAAWLGAYCASALRLHAPVLESAVSGQPVIPVLKRQLLPALIAGLLVGLFLFAANTYGPEAWVSVQSSYYPSLLTRIVYGGVTEEILLRWGFMSTLAWLFWRMFQRRGGEPRAALLWAAVVLSALLFGLGHLPPVAAEVGGLTPSLVAFIVVANMSAGIAFGWLYWRHGLECAMIAHALAHLVNYLLS